MKPTRLLSWQVVLLGCAISPLVTRTGYAQTGPEVHAEKTAELIRDRDSDTQPDSGDVIRYTIIIKNRGTAPALGVKFQDTIDENTTLIPDSIRSLPVAVPDDYAATGNVPIRVPAPGVLGNDLDPDGGPISAHPIIDGLSAAGGNVDLAANGAFAYNPPAGFNGVDSFPYTLEDADGNIDIGIVTIAVTDMIWFVDATATCPCDGRLGSPFNDLTTTADSFDRNAADDPGDAIFVARGRYNGGLQLLNEQRLVGDGSSEDLATVLGITLAPFSHALPAFSGVDPVLESQSDGIRLSRDNVIRGLTIGYCEGSGIRGSFVNTISVSEVTIAGAWGGVSISNSVVDVSLDALTVNGIFEPGIMLSGVTGTFTILDPASSIRVDSAPALDLIGAAGGLKVTATFADISTYNSHSAGIRGTNAAGSTLRCGNTTVVGSFGAGVALHSCQHSSFQFTRLDIDNTATGQSGVLASQAGRIYTGAGTIDTGPASAVDIDNTELDITLTSVRSVGGSSPGIHLDTTTGSFEVVGDGAPTSLGGNGSGGTIANKTGSDGTGNGIGVLLRYATNVVLRQMHLADFDNFAIHGTYVAGFALTDSTIDGVNGNAAAADEGSVSFTNLLDAAVILDSIIGGGFANNVHVVNSAGTLNRLLVDNTTIDGNDAALGNDGILLVANGSAELNVSVTNSRLTSARGDLFQTVANDTASMTIELADNRFSNNHPNIVSGGGGVTISGGGDSRVTYGILRNEMRDAVGTAINVFMGGSGSAEWSGTIDGNVIGNAAVSGSGSEQATGISVEVQGNGTHTTTITNNNVVEYGEWGIKLMAIDGAGRLNANVTNNAVTQPNINVFPMEAFYLQTGAGGGDTNVACADIRDNTFVGASLMGYNDFWLSQRLSSTVQLPGYAGGPYDTAAVIAFVQANNNGPPTGFATIDSLGGGFQNTPGGGPCGGPLVAKRGQGPGGIEAASVSAGELNAVVEEAIRVWLATSLTEAQRSFLSQVTVEVTDLPDGMLGRTSGTAVDIDVNGAGYGWFVDATPRRNEEFVPTAYDTVMLGRPDRTSTGRMDLLSVVVHELGHVLGYDHDTHRHAVMSAAMDTGERRLPRADSHSGIEAVEAVEPVGMADASGGVASGETINLTIGDMPPEAMVVFTFDVVIDDPLPIPSPSQICNQGMVRGENFDAIVTDDPIPRGTQDPTCLAMPVRGACCVDTVCSIESGRDCEMQEGIYQGDDTSCDPNPCLCGDIDGDNDVDDWDFQLLIASLGRFAGDGTGLYNPDADLNGDGIVDFLDLAMFIDCYRRALGDPTAQPSLVLRFDYDADRDVDVVDYHYLWECALTPGAGLPLPCSLHFDVDNNGRILLNDFAEFQSALTPVP